MAVGQESRLDETREFNRRLEETLSTMPPVHTVEPAVTRAAREAGTGIFPPPERLAEARERAVEGPAGPVPLRVFVPPEVAAVYLHYHGGGWVLGAHDQSDVALWHLARHAGVAVVSVGYRLAPEHPYPAGPDDCEAAALWLAANAEREFGSSRILVGGESAGAHLAVTTILRLRDRHGLTPFSAANLVFGVFDLGLTPSQRLWGDRNLVLSTPIMQWFYDCFLPGTDTDQRRAPDISPLYADLTGVPSAMFTVGTLDPLVDDTLFMEARWRLAGAPTRLALYEEAVHGFTAFPLSIAEEANDAQMAFIREAAHAG